MATPMLRSHAFRPRKLIVGPAVLKMKPTIELMRMATDLRPLFNALTITPIVVPTARTTAETVKPYFLNMFITPHKAIIWSKIVLSHSQEHQYRLMLLKMRENNSGCVSLATFSFARSLVARSLFSS